MTRQKSLQDTINTDEESAFWANHDPDQFVDDIDFSDQFTNLKPSTKIITLRVPEHLLTNIKLIANKRDIPYQSLLKHFLQEKVNKELQTPFLRLRRNIARKSAITAFSLFALLAIGYGFVAQPIHAQGISMAPNYNTNTYYLLDKLAYTVSSPQRGDVVVFSSPSQPKSNFFKRIIALPEEKISIKDGNVYINGEKIYESYATGQNQTKSFPSANQELTVPGNSYYVLGDNRESSTDSRDFGFITKENITGKVSVCYWNCK